jgi:hypothetical protein
VPVVRGNPSREELLLGGVDGRLPERASAAKQSVLDFNEFNFCIADIMQLIEK